jgi:hypothetical protein
MSNYRHERGNWARSSSHFLPGLAQNVKTTFHVSPTRQLTPHSPADPHLPADPPLASSEQLTVSAHASENGRWVDLNVSKEIPLNILDRFEAMEADSDMEEETSTEGEKGPSSH